LVSEENMLIPVMTYWDTEIECFVSQSIIHQDGIPLISNLREMQEVPARYTNICGKETKDFTLELNIKLLNEKAKVPTRAHSDDVGMDIYATEEVILASRFEGQGQDKDPARAIIGTGLAFELPQGLGLFIWDRSSLSAKDGIHRVAGVLDPGYRNELRIALVNLSNKPYHIKIGDRIAQAVVASIILPKINIITELSSTARGKGGFGSSGR